MTSSKERRQLANPEMPNRCFRREKWPSTVCKSRLVTSEWQHNHKSQYVVVVVVVPFDIDDGGADATSEILAALSIDMCMYPANVSASVLRLESFLY